jgi:Xaa-Pro aminopeptidase
MIFNQPRALAKMDEYGVDAIVGATPRNFYYISEYYASVTQWGFLENIGAAIVPRDESKKPTLVLPEGLVGGLLAYPTWMPKIRPTEFMNTSIIARVPEPVRLDPLQSDVEQIYADKEIGNPADNVVIATIDSLRELGLESATVAFDDLRLAQHVQRELPSLKVVDGIDLFLDIRKVKTAEEIERLRFGVKINQAAVEDVIPMLKPGQVWGECAQTYRDSINAHEHAKVLAPEKALQFGAEYEGEYYPDVLVEYDSPWKVRDGRPIIFEVWGTYKDYAFDFSRTVHVGDPPDEYLQLCTEFLGAWRQGVEAVLKPGISTHELFKTAYAMVAETNIPTPKKTLPFFHSIGLDIIEQPNGYPSLGRLKSWELEENVVMNCELLYFGHTIAPYHIESTFLITGDGAELLQTMPEDLQVLA